MFSSFSVICSVIGLCVVGSTLYEFIAEAIQRDINTLYSSFSLLGNIRSILHLVPRTKKSGMIECAHGIRALSMIWIIVVHIHEFLLVVLWKNNPTVWKYIGTFVPSVLHFTGYLAVDTFLVLSGMLVAMSMLRELDKKGKINPLKLYFHRYIRITAPLAAMILFVVSFAGYMGEGVLWKVHMDGFKQSCVTNWWAALLHVQNYVAKNDMVS